MTYRFGPFRADRIGYRVFEADRALDLTPKLLDLLFYLLERPATLVTKEELLEQVWPGANVTDNALAQAILGFSDALNDSPSAPTYIRTVARLRIPVRRAGGGGGRTAGVVRNRGLRPRLDGLRLPRSDSRDDQPRRARLRERGRAIRTWRGSARASPKRSRAIWPR